MERHRRRCTYLCGSTARPSTICTSAPCSKMAGETRIFEWRVPPPSITSFLCMMRESTQSGRAAGSPSGVTPPIVISRHAFGLFGRCERHPPRGEPLAHAPVHIEPGMCKERAGRETLTSRLGLHDDGVHGVLGGIPVVFAEQHGVREIRITGHHLVVEPRLDEQSLDGVRNDGFVHCARKSGPAAQCSSHHPLNGRRRFPWRGDGLII